MSFAQEAPRLRVKVIAPPAVGGNITITPDEGATWVVRALEYTLTTSAVVATRYSSLAVTDGNAEYWRGQPMTAQRPSAVERYVYDAGGRGETPNYNDFGRSAGAVAVAAAGQNAALAAGDYLTGFDLNFQAPGAAAVADVVVSNVQGGPLTYRISIPVGGKDLSISYEQALPAQTGLVAPTVTVPAIVGGPAYSIVLHGLSGQLAAAEFGQMPDGGIILQPGWVLSTVTTNIDVADQYSAVVALIETYPTGPQWYGTPIAEPYREPLDG